VLDPTGRFPLADLADSILYRDPYRSDLAAPCQRGVPEHFRTVARANEHMHWAIGLPLIMLEQRAHMMTTT
jgi:hypothetical protein